MDLLFDKTDSAFSPFFSDLVSVNGMRSNNKSFNTSFNASIFPIQSTEPFTDQTITSDLKMIQITADLSLYPKLQIGDILTMEDSTKWTISKLEKSLGNTVIEAKEIK